MVHGLALNTGILYKIKGYIDGFRILLCNTQQIANRHLIPSMIT